MKKGRPGIVLSVLADQVNVDIVLRIVFRETSSIGVRMQTMLRKKLTRNAKDVRTSFGVVHVKSVLNDGKELLVPEFEECKRIAVEKGLPLRDVYRILEKELAEITNGQK
jgi:uncharacterized protein (DUF111 family)